MFYKLIECENSLYTMFMTSPNKNLAINTVVITKRLRLVFRYLLLTSQGRMLRYCWVLVTWKLYYEIVVDGYPLSFRYILNSHFKLCRCEQLYQQTIVIRRCTEDGAWEVNAIVFFGSDKHALVVIGQTHIESAKAAVLFVQYRPVSG